MAYKINEDCTACGTCIDECPVGAISEGDTTKLIRIPAPIVVHVLMFAL
jgi:ferredoxin